MRFREAEPQKLRTNAVRRLCAITDGPAFRCANFVAQKVHFRCGAKRVLDDLNEISTARAHEHPGA
jgi:hypothetical protein